MKNVSLQELFCQRAKLLICRGKHPLAALFLSRFCRTRGFWKRDAVRTEVTTGSTLPDGIFRTWLFLLRFVAPVAILFVFLNGIGVL